MLSRSARAVAVAGAAAGVLALGISQASAASTYTVKAGSAKTGATVALTGTTTGASPQIHFSDSTTGTALTCASGTIAGSTKVGTGLAAAGLATVTGSKTAFKSCSGPLGLTLGVVGSGTWKLNATKYANGVTTGSLTGVSAVVSTSDGTTCKFTAKGSVGGNYKNSTTTLTATGTPTLTISGVTGCFGLVKNGDKATFKAAFKIKATVAADNPVTITSP